MADLSTIVGVMLATGLGGHSARGPVFASATRTPPQAGWGGTGQPSGMAVLGELAYGAYQRIKAADPSAELAPTMYLQARSARGDGPSTGDRVADALVHGPASTDPAIIPGDDRALLLIRAMVAAAGAEGGIGDAERERLLSTLDRIGVDAGGRQALTAELDDPPSLEDVAGQARAIGAASGVEAGELAEEVWLASHLALRPDSAAGADYLDRLAGHLDLPAARRDELRRIA